MGVSVAHSWNVGDTAWVTGDGSYMTSTVGWCSSGSTREECRDEHGSCRKRCRTQGRCEVHPQHRTKKECEDYIVGCNRWKPVHQSGVSVWKCSATWIPKGCWISYADQQVTLVEKFDYTKKWECELLEKCPCGPNCIVISRGSRCKWKQIRCLPDVKEEYLSRTKPARSVSLHERVEQGWVPWTSPVHRRTYWIRQERRRRLTTLERVFEKILPPSETTDDEM